MTGIDLFAGCGGASLGLVAAGIDVVAAYDFDAATVRGHRALLPGCPAYQADLATLDSVPAVDLWWASPPCQPFSSAGKRKGAADERNGYPHLLRLLGRCAPTWLIIENVPGLAQHRAGAVCGALWPKPETCPACYLETVLRRLREWFAVVETHELDAADYGVPQHRRRLITACGPGRIAWPEPTHGPGRARPWVSAGEALGLTGALEYKGNHYAWTQRSVQRPAPTVNTMDEIYLSVGGPNARGGRGASVTTLADPSPGVRTNADIYLVATGHTGEGRPRDPDQPAPAVSGGATMQLVVHNGTGFANFRGNASPISASSGGLRAGGAPVLCETDGQTYRRLRTLTVRERATLQSLPWVPELTGRTVGNAVPPPLARVVVEAVVATEAKRGGSP